MSGIIKRGSPKHNLHLELLKKEKSAKAKASEKEPEVKTPPQKTEETGK